MDSSSSSSSVDLNSGFSSKTKTFQSLRPPLLLPPESSPLSAASYALSLQQNTSPWLKSTAFIDSSTGRRISFSDFRQRVVSLASSIQNTLRLSKNDVAFVLSPNSTHIPILYFSLLSLGIVISPANPLSTESELLRQIKLTKPVIAFATSRNFQKLPKLKHPAVLIDSPEFESMMTNTNTGYLKFETVEVNQSDLAAIMYSSGTTGDVKGVKLTQQNFIASIANYHAQRPERNSPAVMLYTVPLFHVFGFHYILKSVTLTETVVVMERFDLKKMLKTVEDFKVTQLVVAPPVVVAMAKGSVTHGYDLSSLEAVGSGGAPLGKDVMQAFGDRFPNIILFQGYGLTETAGAAFRAATTEEMLRRGSVGRLLANSEAKIVDADTGIVLPPGEQGELWIKGPTIMQGYFDDPKNTSETLMPGGWLRTGDLCYIDHHGYLFVVDRLKELIKYKGYQVAPAELEQLLQSHPEIVDAAVIPYPDEEAGQLPMAFVVRRPRSSLVKEQVIDFISKQVAPYKKIRRVAFVSSIPKSPSGKILRKELKRIHLTGSKL
ncbi:4-coumarate--CoA ligase-like 9 [Solanum dulcamara]|uniref:4-coumarate--CoA ligase-like 9 n=1 Tax=Solanum dulcamara TaxID=45834 RepID=UPI002484DB9D|nr:4-coumarate--CoA ligase-like 9 [Solanum dulcamara]